jgi:hypothetical protein
MVKPFAPYYLEMNCIGDTADFVVYSNFDMAKSESASACAWMVPGSWEGRDEFGRKTTITGYPQEA